MSELPQLVTQLAPDAPSELWRYVEGAVPAFTPDCFDEQALARNNLIDGMASAGRGNTIFFTRDGKQLVLRHYRRGGLVRHISQAHYIYTGMAGTRALKEFDMLVHLQGLSLPAPLPYACRVRRKGLFYIASLVTYRLPGKTLAQRLVDGAAHGQDHALSVRQWQDLGSTIARFHSAGIYHADLNAHNILIEDDKQISLLDFDRSCVKSMPDRPTESGWCQENISRLLRSITKLVKDNTALEGFSVCKAQWRNSLA